MKYRIGDRVQIVNYGHLLHEGKQGKWRTIDINPGLIGQKGTISGYAPSGNNSYRLERDIEGSISWMDEDQLEMLPKEQEVDECDATKAKSVIPPPEQ